jgi:hypothetical protein
LTAPSPTFSIRPVVSETNIDCTVSGPSATSPSTIVSIVTRVALMLRSVNGSPPSSFM